MRLSCLVLLVGCVSGVFSAIESHDERVIRSGYGSLGDVLGGNSGLSTSLRSFHGGFGAGRPLQPYPSGLQRPMYISVFDGRLFPMAAIDN